MNKENNEKMEGEKGERGVYLRVGCEKMAVAELEGGGGSSSDDCEVRSMEDDDLLKDVLVGMKMEVIIIYLNQLNTYVYIIDMKFLFLNIGVLKHLRRKSTFNQYPMPL